jgi:hypothetical protein
MHINNYKKTDMNMVNCLAHWIVHFSHNYNNIIPCHWIISYNYSWMLIIQLRFEGILRS